jgi:hypothetical protein
MEGGMRDHRTTTRILTLLACCLAAGSAPALGQGVYSAGLFELGDGLAPAGFSGAADILGTADQPGPDWAELFTAEGGPRAGARGAVFIADDVSLGSGFEGTELAGSPDLVRNGRVAAADDIGNAYVYSTRDAAGHTVLYLGAERLSDGDSYLEFELNQAVVRLGHGGFGQGKPWKVLGTRAANDVLVRLDFASGTLASVTVSRRSDGEWQTLAAFSGQGCDEAESLCAISNAGTVEGGPWDSGEIAPGRFVEVGVNLGALLGAEPALTSIRVRTPDDIAFGYFAEGN